MEAVAAQIRDERGQSLIEYTLLLAFVALVVAALFAGSGSSIQGMWSTANSTIASANDPSAGSASAPPADPGGGGTGGTGGSSGGSGGNGGNGGDGDHGGHDGDGH